MTKKRSTKSALLMSVLSLVLCLSMLTGTTFAWFTDSVTSANNKIVAGNLDVELKYAKIEDGAITGWETVQGKDNIFDKNALWEPGRVEVVYLEVSNLGSLALKYQLGVNVAREIPGINVSGTTFSLSDHLVFKVVDLAAKPTTAYTRAEAAQVAGEVKGLKDYNGTTTPLEVGVFDYVALIVYMPESVGNEANYRGTEIPTIELGINLYATQLAAEEDSFGPDYDEGANHTEFKVTTANDLQNALNEATSGDEIDLVSDLVLTKAIEIPAAATTFSMRSTPAPIVIDLNGNNITIEAAYDENNYTASSAIVNYGNVVLTGKGTIKATNNYTVRNHGNMVIDGVTVENGMMNFADMTVESGNISNSRSGKHTIYGSAATLTINGGTFYNGNPGNAAIYSSAGEVTINGGEFSIADGTATLGWTSCLLDAQGGAKYTINGGIVNGEIRDYGNNTLIYGGTFAHNPGKVAEGYEAKQNTDGSYSVVIKGETLTDSVQVPNAEVYVPAGTYTFPSNVAEGVVINCAPGTVFTGKTGLNLPGATVIGATFKNEDIAVSGTINGTFQNCTFEGSEALRWCYSTEGETVVFENCVIKTDFRGFHFDGMNGNVIFRNCEINGFNAYSGTGTITFEGCTFGNDESKYNGLNVYSNTVLKDCEFNFVSDKTNFIDMEGIGKTLTITNCTATLDGEEANVLDFVGGSKLNQNTLIVDGMQCALNADQLVAAINAGAKEVTLAAGNYALRFTNNTNFNLNDMTIKGLGDVNLAISSSEAWYGRVQGSNVTFENIHFTSSVGATGKATYKNCTFDSWAICASSNNEETTFNNCKINGCLNTSTDFSSGNVFVNNCEIAKAEYSGSMTMNFVDCQIGEIIIWNANTNLTNCKVTKLDKSNVTTATVTIK